MNVRLYPQAKDGHGVIAVAVTLSGVEFQRRTLSLNEARDLHQRLGVAIRDAEGIDAAARPRVGEFKPVE